LARGKLKRITRWGRSWEKIGMFYEANLDNVERVVCRMCDLSLDTRQVSTEASHRCSCDDLPKRYPFHCSQARTSLHSLIMHYGVDHQVSVEIY
jgi:hypothetical protein